MQDPLDIDSKTQNLNAALEKHLGVRGRSLDQRLRRTGRRLPRRLRKQAALLAHAQAVNGNIKLTRQFDVKQVERGYAEVSEHLAQIDRADTRRAQLTSILAVLAFNFIAIFGAFVWFLWMRGTI